MAKRYPTVLSIAGSDSIGGAGIQADIKTCCALGVYAMTAVTAVTAQNTYSVDRYEPVSADMLRAQLKAISDDVRPDAVKIGMLPSVELQNVVARWLRKTRIEKVVLDPVMVSTSGHKLSDGNVCGNIIDSLLPLVEIFTPNFPEAKALVAALTGRDEPLSLEAAGKLLDFVPCLLLKGGHSGYATKEWTIHDYLLSRYEGLHTFSHPRLNTRNTHGTGCSLSAAIAAHRALGYPVWKSVGLSIEWLQQALKHGESVSFGHGHGPVCHNFEFAKFINIDVD